MGFWNKLGKIALQAAPYVAAPFTGGASLYFTPATQKLGQKWAESDAKKAAAKGLAPSKFDKYLGLASNVAGFAGGTGALGKFGSAAYSGAKAGSTAANVASAASKGKKIADTAQKLSGWQNALKAGGQTASLMAGGSPYAGGANYTGSAPDGGGRGWQGELAGIVGGALANQGGGGGRYEPTSSGLPPVGSQAQQRGTTGMAGALARGTQIALQNQPFRAGYDVRTEGPEEGQITTSRMPPIHPQYQPPPNIGPWAQPNAFQQTGFQQNLSDQVQGSRYNRLNQPRRRNPDEEFN